MRKRFVITIGVLGCAFILAIFCLRSFRTPHQNSNQATNNAKSLARSDGPTELPLSYNEAASATQPKTEVRHEVKALFERLFGDYKKRIESRGHPPSTRFAAEAYFRLREARLLALTEPEQVIPLASSLAQDQSRTILERQFGIKILRLLLEEGKKSAESQLLLIAHDKERQVSMGALYALAEQDTLGVHRALYQQKCSQGWDEAYDLLSFWPDARLRQSISKLKDSAEKDLKLVGSELSERVEILLASDSASKIERLVSTVGGDVEHWTPWAIKVAKLTSLPTLKDALRRRLDWAFNKASEHNQTRQAFFEPDPQKPNFEETYIKSSSIASFPDQLHDQILLEFARLGGQLTELEKKRCRYFGYFCDPKERLAELLVEGR